MLDLMNLLQSSVALAVAQFSRYGYIAKGLVRNYYLFDQSNKYRIFRGNDESKVSRLNSVNNHAEFSSLLINVFMRQIMKKQKTLLNIPHHLVNIIYGKNSKLFDLIFSQI